MPPRTSGVSRWRSTTRVPASDSNTRSRSSAAAWSVEPSRRNLKFARMSRMSWRLLIRPFLKAARANWNALDPSISVLSRSKKAAALPPPSATAPTLPPVDLEDHGISLAAARADRRDSETAAAAAQLVHERHEDAGAARADRMAEGDRAAVDVDLRLIHAEHPHRVDRHRGERLVDLEEVDVVDREAGLVERR